MEEYISRIKERILSLKRERDFLTKKLNEIIPRTGTGWKNKEQFVFELDFWPKAIRFKTVISPGNDTVRKMLSDKLSKIDGATPPKGKRWLVHFRYNKKMDVTSEKNDNEKIISVVEKILNEVGFEILEMKPRLLNTYIANVDNMRPAKNYDKHDWAGCLVKCKKIYENDTCVFNCSVNVGRNCLNRRFNGRFVVTHSGWAAIFDENFTFNCKTYFLIELPKRGYNYVMRGGVYDENKDFGTVQ